MNGDTQTDEKEPLELGLSPCPNDTFIFHALLSGLVPSPVPLRPYFADVEDLNARVRQGSLPISKISLGVVPAIMDRYALLSSGAALGWGCGPLVVARRALAPEDMATLPVAIPGIWTTANLLLSLHGGFGGPRVPMLFSDIMPAIVRGEVEVGVVIHEGRFTYAEKGLVKVLDMGEWWEGRFHCPLPLGAIVVRRDVPKALARALQAAIRASLRHARAHPEDGKAFIAGHAQELDEGVIRAHIETFVTDFSLDLGVQGRDAILRLVGDAAAREELTAPSDGFFLDDD
ncbi:MAG: 1,4-dihydroxy-6-naphthoate synthase [Desulfovibrio sp.]|jgi:1,4-dihydroxy-6-naphthoate synthase|nr:1,4-dihydroxy-6-naphthoate synthase [Desulfovibrio sp.]